MAQNDYAEQPGIPDPLEQLQRARSQYTTYQPTTTIGDYSWRAPQHPLMEKPRRSGGGLSFSGIGGLGGITVEGGGGAPRGGAGRSSEGPPQWNPAWDEPQPESDEPQAGDGSGSGRNYNDKPFDYILGSSGGEPVTKPTSPSPYL
jgi:hypothetical protein